jgi:hypothetical protein
MCHADACELLARPTHGSEVDYLKKWLHDRVAWMGAQYSREFGACPAAN